MNAQLAKANGELQEKRDNLQAVIDRVAELQKQCDDTVAEKDRLMNAQAQTALRLTNAEKLTGGLSSEGVRWKANLGLFNDQRIMLIGDTLLSCAAISYYGPFTGVYREQLFRQWAEMSKELDLPSSEAPTLLGTVGDPVQVREWQTQLLPTDEVSTNNAILVTQGQRWPLMIDPQAQANRWIRKMLEKDGLLTSTRGRAEILFRPPVSTAVAAEYPRRGRDAAVPRLRGLVRPSPPPWNIHVVAVASPRLDSTDSHVNSQVR